MKKFLLVLCLSVGGSSFAQDADEYVSNGISFKVGDTIQLGRPSGGSFYAYIKKHSPSSGPEMIHDNLSSRKYVICDIHVTSSTVVKAFYRDPPRVISFCTKGFWAMTYYADIDEALKNGEIILDLDKALRDSKKVMPAELLTEDRLANEIAFLSFVKGLRTFSLEQFAEEYMFRYMNALYTRTHDDEFDYRKALAIAKNQIALGIERIDSTNKFNVFIKMTLKNYDFENGGFPTDVTDNPIYEVVDWSSLFMPIGLTFADFRKLQSIKVPENEAKLFLEKMKDSYGMVNREVFAKIKIKITHSMDKSKESSDRRLLIGEITSFELYDANANLVGTYSF
ncbi:MAG: DUF4852 domain-containing protein [Prevotellaceae bacterium]|jgi:hypothetical protein|nr:DUF4852 domain-containing protein [Prevotellaceae bacterium]